ncbi:MULTISPECIES: AzlC family ABC transporter permease [Halanaerobium]|jgi:4-azaleucine resistance transporter AzlC|uniref:4-azaleucine resistance transporter AzlC n=1 Tax=Halanaerobium saccharolyticum TaxID=43595 RepID=A0A4R6RXL0_9FIRM|nr:MULTISPECIES: AzlC family ABC transporter permease [Halanaerobium]PUU90322.1 MAG: AzlC family protein [Halanaerobium sp.]PUU95729.1 MAG: AzlC family protein [Halanaerobium sp.]TDP91277.1 4-azaleucine resistance transporter AzlC [Halanaerobium saccharolyticum]
MSQQEESISYKKKMAAKLNDSSLKAGVKDAVPIILGYLPIGIAYGMLAVNKGLTPLQTTAMSVFVFAGSAQLVAIEMIAAGAAVAAIIAMTFLVNLRHLLLSASLSLHLRNLPLYYYPFLGFLVTDESFAVAMSKLESKKKKQRYFLGLGFTAYLGWVFSSAAGAFLTEFINFGSGGALDFVLPAMFIVLLVMQISSRSEIIVAVFSGLLSLFFALTVEGSWNIILATVLAAFLGVYISGND